MLPYSPLHHLLLADVGEPLVMTSGNVSDEPIAYEDDDALERLSDIADAFLLHDRPIETRTDDSVLRIARHRALPLRRSRGAVPSVLALPVPAVRHTLATGAELKSTFCLARGRRAWVSHHIGDLKNVETLGSFETGIAHFETLFAVAPEVVAHDLHPDYLSTTYALAREDVERVAVQHHHAHLAACLAEHGETGRRSARSSTAPGSAATGRCGEGRSSSATCKASSARGTCGRSRSRAVTVPRGSRGGWRARGVSRQVATRAAARRCRGGALARGCAVGRDRLRLATDDEGRPPVRRCRRALRAAAGGQLRGAGGDGARGGVRRQRARRLPAARGRRRARRARDDPGDRS